MVLQQNPIDLTYDFFFREPYGSNMQCDYRIYVSRGSTISLVVTDIEMEAHYECEFDYISVYYFSNS